jgi:hypothetical protein
MAQKVLIVCGLVAFALCGLFPPWHYGGVRGGSTGYHFIFDPPSGQYLDATCLLVEWLCIAAITGAAWLLVGIHQKRAKPSQVSPP